MDGVVVLHCEEEDKGHPVVVVVEVEMDGVEAKSNLMRNKKTKIPHMGDHESLNVCVKEHKYRTKFSVRCHMQGVTYKVSHVRCHVLCVICHISHLGGEGSQEIL